MTKRSAKPARIKSPSDTETYLDSPAKDVLEHSVKAALGKYLKEIGAYQYWPVPMGYGAKTVDCFFCYRGLFFAVECKRSSVSEPTASQAEMLRQVAAADGGTCVGKRSRVAECGGNAAKSIA